MHRVPPSGIKTEVLQCTYIAATSAPVIQYRHVWFQLEVANGATGRQ
ncbi:hypothetical protein GCM10009548_69270 [Streptomyces malaysiensis subsp. malaysiensis]|uniref:Uncharacterized protein n=1 Tax=Streptomyces malaysiensis TaxID=92644 RepID=A0A2J7YWA2_STRMQ|nr:hypothetical protein SMF913_27765 [Streptomyces malaysiensis]